MKLAALADMWLQYPVGTKDEVATLIGGNCGDNITKYDWPTAPNFECLRLLACGG